MDVCVALIVAMVSSAVLTRGARAANVSGASALRPG